MMFQSIVLLSFLATASAFAPAAKFSMATRISMSDVEPVAEVAEEVVEVAEPVFKFDPKSQPGKQLTSITASKRATHQHYCFKVSAALPFKQFLTHLNHI